MGNSCFTKKSEKIVSINKSFSTPRSTNLEICLPEAFISGRQILWKKGELLAEGKFSKIYQCINMKTGELLVLKSYPTSRSSSGFIQELKRIKKETEFLKRIEHKNIIKLYQSENSNESLDFIMECIPGGCLEEIIHKYGSLEEEIIKNYLKQTLEVLNFLHSLGISHNNIRPETIFVSSEGKVKISGFKNYSNLPQNGLEYSENAEKISFFHQFLAPEVLNGEVLENSDVWSVGCLAIQMASGKEPFGYLSSDNEELINIIASKDFVFRYPKVSNTLKNFIESCLKIDPHARPHVKDLLKHEAITGKKNFSFDVTGDESLKVSLSRTADCQNAIAELDNE